MSISKDLNFYVNTDTVDMDNKQIGISSGGNDREFAIGVNHHGSQESVAKATEIAKVLADAANQHFGTEKTTSPYEHTNTCEAMVNAITILAKQILETSTCEMALDEARCMLDIHESKKNNIEWLTDKLNQATLDLPEMVEQVTFTMDELDGLLKHDSANPIVHHIFEKNGFHDKLNAFKGITGYREKDGDSGFSFWIEMAEMFDVAKNNDFSEVGNLLKTEIEKLNFKTVYFSFSPTTVSDGLLDDFHYSVGMTTIDQDMENILSDIQMIVDVCSKFDVVLPRKLQLKKKA